MATHLRITTGFTIPFDLKEHFSFTQLLVRTAQQTHRLVPPAAQDDVGEGAVLGPCATVLVRGAVDGATVRDWLAAVNDGVPANAVVMRPAIGFEIPKDAGSPLILIVMQDPGVVCPVAVVLVVGRSVSARYTSAALRVHASPSHMVSVLSFVSASL